MALTVYDKAKWHFESEDFPHGVLDVGCGGTHIAFFLKWCIENDFLSKEILDESSKAVEDVKLGKMNCRDFLMQELDGVLSSEELNTKGQKFANAYYKSGKTKFAKRFDWYLSDYDKLTCQFIMEPYTRDNWYFYFENSEENYLLVKNIIDQRYTAAVSGGYLR
jgi:hypothetical protein